MAEQIIGRAAEQIAMQQALQSPKAVFMAMYGRRRIGKTYLIKNAFEKDLIFYHTAKSNSGIQVQLNNWGDSINEYSAAKKTIATPTTWPDAFKQLKQLITQSKKKKKVVFIDEVPWLDTTNSDFLPSLEHFWNSWCSHQKEVVLVVCGSASSWIINKLINNHGGLHNRITHSVHLEPFTLKESEDYFKHRNARYGRAELIEAYMCIGGIPYYMDLFDIKKSVRQNINDLFFSSNAPLKREFDNLYASLFKKPEKYVSIIQALGTKKRGLSREELIKATQLTNGGSTTKMLKELEEARFIRTYKSIDKKSKMQLYQLIDLYSLFYIGFVAQMSKLNIKYWIQIQNQSVHKAWSGYAFEMVALHHIHQIKSALGIEGILTNTGGWIGKGAQIDLIIDRVDKSINIIEMKFYESTYSITKSVAGQLQKKIEIFKQETQTKKSVSLCMLTANGLAQNQYSYLALHQLTGDDLFKF